jgi:RNA polymerase sigma factor (sigma-70 family)
MNGVELLDSLGNMDRLIARHWKRRHPLVDWDDLIQEIQLGFLKACQTFDESQGVPFPAKAWFAGMHEARQWCRKELCRGLRTSKWVNGAISLNDDKNGEKSALIDSISDRIGEEIEMFPSSFWERMRSWLGRSQFEVIDKRFRRGLSLEETGKELGITIHRVEQLQSQALQRLVDFDGLLEGVEYRIPVCDV